MFYDKKMRHRFMLNISLFALVHFFAIVLEFDCDCYVKS